MLKTKNKLNLGSLGFLDMWKIGISRGRWPQGWIS